MTKINCKNKKNHTKCPSSYVEWCRWADEMVKKGYRQYVCPVCGRYDIWEKPIINKNRKINNICNYSYLK